MDSAAFDPSLMDDVEDDEDNPKNRREDGPTVVDDVKWLSDSDSDDGKERRLDWLYEAAPTGKDNNDINAAFKIDSAATGEVDEMWWVKDKTSAGALFHGGMKAGMNTGDMW